MTVLIEFAAAEGRAYVTPEDVQNAIDAGAEKVVLFEELLRHIESRNVEDVTLACFVAVQWKSSEELGGNG
jgi:hypothetical protein